MKQGTEAAMNTPSSVGDGVDSVDHDLMLNRDASWNHHPVGANVDERLQRIPSNVMNGVPDDPSGYASHNEENYDDDEDNWSRQVETDEIQRMPSSLAGDMTMMDGEDYGVSTSITSVADVIPPQREEPTLKEKLVERERQRRVETERARWRRQFASTTHTEEDDEDKNEEINSDVEPNRYPFDGAWDLRETQSVAGTVGEDTVAPIEILDEDSTKMNYPMERFLKEQEDSIQESKAKNKPAAIDQGVVMERFLHGPPVVNNGATALDVVDTPTNVQRSVSFERVHIQAGVATDASLSRHFFNISTASSSIADTSTDRACVEEVLAPTRNGTLPLEVLHSEPGSVTFASMARLSNSENERQQHEGLLEIPGDSESSLKDRQGVVSNVQFVDFSEVQDVSDVPHEPENQSQPRVLRLTEAEIEAMAAIDEASRSNAPPSERDDMSELGELVSDFGGPIHLDHPNNSQGTPTTALESASHIADDQLSVDAMGTASVSSHVVASSVCGDVSLAANPPSEKDEEEDEGTNDILTSSSTAFVTQEELQVQSNDSPVAAVNTCGQLAFNRKIVNRTVRPGLYNYKNEAKEDVGNRPESPVARLAKASSLSDDAINANHLDHVEGFDFDKNAPNSPNSPTVYSRSNNAVFRNEIWSSGLSPVPHQQVNEASSLPSLPGYGADISEHDMETQRIGPSRNWDKPPVAALDAGANDEHTPLLDAIPVEVFGSRRLSSITSIRTMDDLHSLADSIFSDVRSEGLSTVQSISNEAQEYLDSSILQRAYPERLFALTVTLLFEIPVLLMVSGGSDRLCYLIGRSKYQLLLGFLPLSSAISGNVGLQSSTLTTRAISHGQVKVENYKTWWFKEIGAATYLGLGMGGFLGTIAFFASGNSLAFGVTVMIAQFISILTAGFTGTFAPLLFTFIFKRDSGKWGGPLETAVQDIVGSFAMVIISYHILVWMGPYYISENDTCGSEAR